MFTKKCIFAR